MNELAFFISKAPLPIAYREACTALAHCERVDECKDWSDRAAALASYARQAKDQALFNAAMRIQVRAVDRAGALLKEFDGHGNNQHTDGADSKLTQREAAEAAGMSERQQVTAVRVNNVPRDEFEELVESDTPPTVTELARAGTRKRQREPDPIGPVWADWVFSVKHLRSLPTCGLEALAARRELPASRLIADAEAALENLELWIKTLEGIDAV